MKKPESIEELRDIAFTIPDMGMEIKLKKTKEYSYVEPYFIFKKLYSIADGKVIFYSNGNGYMLPYFIGVREILESNGYEETYLQPFFTNEEILVDKELAKKWKALEDMANELEKPYRRHYIFSILKAQPLSSELRKKALKIPQEGLMAYHTTQGIINVLPIIPHEHKLEREDYAKLGTYTVLKSIAAIESVEVETYLMRLTSDTEAKLRRLGYKENHNLKHPLEGVEQFLNPHIQKQFKEL